MLTYKLEGSQNPVYINAFHFVNTIFTPMDFFLYLKAVKIFREKAFGQKFTSIGICKKPSQYLYNDTSTNLKPKLHLLPINTKWGLCRTKMLKWKYTNKINFVFSDSFGRFGLLSLHNRLTGLSNDLTTI